MENGVLFGALVLRGLRRKTVKENPHRIGVVRIDRNLVQADILGLALVGAFGIDRAIELCKDAREDFDMLAGLAAECLKINNKLLKMIGREYCGAHGEISAEAIARRLKEHKKLCFRGGQA